jgi:hypothetical protein
MTIHRSAYDTLACRDFVISKITAGLQAALHIGFLPQQGSQSIRELQGGAAEVDHVPTFQHPFVLVDGKPVPGHPPATYVVIDVRPFGKWDKHQHQYAVRNKTEYGFMRLRGLLTQAWIENPASLNTLTGLPMKMYASWISEKVAQKFALDPREQGLLQVLAAFHYASLFTDEKHLSQSEIHRIATMIKTATGMEGQMILNVLERFQAPLHSIDEFCKVASEVTESIRLKDFNVGFLFDLLGGTFYVANQKEIIAVALEHPPTWIAMLAVAADDRSYKNTYITKLLERLDRRDKGMVLRRAVKVLVEQI